MSDDINYQNNPLNGVGLKQLVSEIVDHYGFEILFAYLNINCFKTNASVESSIKFLKKTEWAREKVEAFYMYEYKSLPRASSSQFALPPRDRIVPDCDQVGEPAELSLEDALERQEAKAEKAAEWDKNRSRKRDNDSSRNKAYQSRSSCSPWPSSAPAKRSNRSSGGDKPDPWGNLKK